MHNHIGASAYWIDERIALIGGGVAIRCKRTGRFVARAHNIDYREGCEVIPARRGPSAAFLAASAQHRNRQALRARVAAKSAPDRSLLKRVRVRAGDLYQNPNAGKRDAYGHIAAQPRLRDTGEAPRRMSGTTVYIGGLH